MRKSFAAVPASGIGALIALFLLAVTTATTVAQTAPYKIVVNHAPPYRIITGERGNTSYSGIYIDIIRMAATRADLSIRFVEVPFARALKMMEVGHADIMLGPNKTPKRQAYMTYLKAALPKETKAFYMLPGAVDVRSYDDLLSRMVFVLNAARYFQPFDSDDRINKHYFNDYLTAMRALRNRPGATVVAPEQLGDYLRREHGLKLKKASFHAPGKTSYITISKRSALHHQREKLEQVLLNMADDGTFAQIIDRYQ